MKLISKSEAKEKISNFFSQNPFEKEEMKKIKKLAMRHRIRITEYKKLFCKNCLSQLKGKIKISRNSKTIECKGCSYKNKFRLQ